ncbi:hypothetical protein [Neobacillus sp. D3-1R]|uniref:hypothetical protein n=1 Tax=Neobacillus sp. D3-1R TaxID=3445778 RepID=UPI003FA0330B
MKRKGTDENVMEFVQTASNSKKFRPDYSVSQELREEMVNEVFRDFMKYALDLYYEDNIPILEEILADLHVREEKLQGLMQNIFWWRLFYESHQKKGTSIIEDYITENHHWLRKKPILISWLRECDKVISKFYFIGYTFNERVFVAVDMLAEETLDVIVFDPHATPPIKGEIAFGTLIPLGGGLFFPITDFYHFDFEARQEIANHLHYYFDKHLKTSPMHEAFIYVLTAMLQIEKMVSLENASSQK